MTEEPMRPARGCCACPAHASHPSPLPSHASPFGVSRREFLQAVGTLTAVGAGLALCPDVAGAQEAPALRDARSAPLRVQPVLTYDRPRRQEATSWRSWGGIQTEKDAVDEAARIGRELEKLKVTADFPLEIRPLETIPDAGRASELAKGDYDTLLMYAAGGGGDVLEAMIKPEKWNLMFLRHQPGPVYLWYEIVHPRLLRKTVDEYGQPGLDTHDVVVDRPEELLWRFRALHGLKNALGKRIVAVGGASGWGWGGQKAPETGRTQFKLDIRDYPYTELGKRIESARQDSALTQRCREEARRFLGEPGVSLHTTREFVENAFVLTQVLKDVMREAGTDAVTINSCMGTIMPMSKTTACLPLSLLNDAGYLAFCESDFVVIPSGILLHYVSGKPVFLNDPTYPHDNLVTLAHCTAPRRMDGRKAERTKVLTHFESDYGAAPKVEMKLGQKVTNLVPDFASKRWVGFLGTIVGNPLLDICRSQIDVRVEGDGDALMDEMKGFHWMTCYGDYRREVGYALRKIGVDWRDVSEKKS